MNTTISLRRIPCSELSAPPNAPCERCHYTGCSWDRIGNHVLCPDCQAKLATGEGELIREALHKNTCVLCQKVGTVQYLTFPLGRDDPLEMYLCPQHFHDYIGRCLKKSEFRLMRRRLQACGLTPDDVFWLHPEYYDDDGTARYPAIEE